MSTPARPPAHLAAPSAGGDRAPLRAWLAPYVACAVAPVAVAYPFMDAVVNGPFPLYVIGYTAWLVTLLRIFGRDSSIEQRTIAMLIVGVVAIGGTFGLMALGVGQEEPAAPVWQPEQPTISPTQPIGDVDRPSPWQPRVGSGAAPTHPAAPATRT